MRLPTLIASALALIAVAAAQPAPPAAVAPEAISDESNGPADQRPIRKKGSQANRLVSRGHAIVSDFR